MPTATRSTNPPAYGQRQALYQLEVAKLRYDAKIKTIYVPVGRATEDFSQACRDAIAQLQKMGFVLQSSIV